MITARPIEDLNRYLAELNASLAVGLRSRSRILEEVGEHLHAAALDQHEELVAQIERGERPATGDALWVEAQARAIAAFGAPGEIAAAFQKGALGALDERVALIDAGFESWLGRRPLLAGTIWAAAISLAWLALGMAIAAAGDLFDAGYAANVLVPFMMVGVISFCIRMVYVLRGRVVTGWRGLPVCQPCGLRLIVLRDFLGFLFFLGFASLTDPMRFTELIAAWVALALVVEGAARLARRAGRARGWSAYDDDPDENWSRYTLGLWTSAAITVVLIAVVASSFELAAAFGLLLVAVSGTTALARRLAWNSSIRRNWGATYAARAKAS